VHKKLMEDQAAIENKWVTEIAAFRVNDNSGSMKQGLDKVLAAQ
jgi:hypothetical protein